MKSNPLIVSALIVIFVSLLFTNDTFGTEWPDTTRVDWNGRSDVLCLEDLVYCLLADGADTSSFLADVALRVHTVFIWWSQSQACYIQILSSQNLATEAEYYKLHNLTRYAGPVMLSGENCWPADDLYADEDMRRQWYLTSEWTGRTSMSESI